MYRVSMYNLETVNVNFVVVKCGYTPLTGSRASKQMKIAKIAETFGNAPPDLIFGSSQSAKAVRRQIIHRS